VSLSERSRSTLYQGLTSLIPDEEAIGEMLSHFPARDLDEPATKDHLRAEVAVLDARMADGFGAVRLEMAAEFAAVRAEMAAGFTAVRVEMADEFAAVRAEMATGFTAVRVEMADEFAAVRAEMAAGFTAVRAEGVAVEQHLNARIDAVQEAVSAEMRRWFLANAAFVLLVVGALAALN